mgnify:FL=1
MKLISRPNYYQKLESVLGKGVLVVLTGQRRVGKSCVMKELMKKKSDSPENNVIYIDKEKTAFDFIVTYRDLVQYIDGHIDAGRHNYILIDEVQEIEGFERGLRNYYNEDCVDIIVTGSNSDILSGELATLLSGRYIEILVQGLSYSEFLEFHNLPDNEQSLGKYMNYGGLPGLRAFGLDNPETINDYLQGIYNTILIKDIVNRKNIRNMPFLENLVKYTGDNIGKPISATNIHNYMESRKEDISKNIVLSYLKATSAAYLINEVERYNIHGKRLLETNSKYYFGDVGIRNFVVGGRRVNDIEKILENLVYQHLVIVGYKVNVGVLNNDEIDFVCSRGDDVRYVQVAYLIHDDDTLRREFGNLLQIKDNNPKYVISMTPYMETGKYEGIRHIDARAFFRDGLI